MKIVRLTHAPQKTFALIDSLKLAAKRAGIRGRLLTRNIKSTGKSLEASAGLKTLKDKTKEAIKIAKNGSDRGKLAVGKGKDLINNSDKLKKIIKVAKSGSDKGKLAVGKGKDLINNSDKLKKIIKVAKSGSDKGKLAVNKAKGAVDSATNKVVSTAFKNHPRLTTKVVRAPKKLKNWWQEKGYAYGRYSDHPEEAVVDFTRNVIKNPGYAAGLYPLPGTTEAGAIVGGTVRKLIPPLKRVLNKSAESFDKSEKAQNFVKKTAKKITDRIPNPRHLPEQLQAKIAEGTTEYVGGHFGDFVNGAVNLGGKVVGAVEPFVQQLFSDQSRSNWRIPRKIK